VPANQLQVAQLATLLCSLIERDDYQAAAQQLATQLAQEQGVTKAIAWLKQRF